MYLMAVHFLVLTTSLTSWSFMDEFTYIPDLLRAAEIYALAIVLLDEAAGEARA